MEIYHKDKLFVEAEEAKSFFEKAKGLMFRNLDYGEGLLIEFSHSSRWSIWMMFVPQDLALFFLDEERKVVDKKYADRITLSPDTWKIYKPEEKCKYVLECNPGTIGDLSTGDELSW